VLVLLASLNACSKAPASVEAPGPQISGNTIRLPANSPIAQHLLTEPVVAGRASTLSLPAHLVWDEDHTSRITSPITGRLSQILVQVGAHVSANQTLAYMSSPDLGSAQTEAARAQADLSQAEHNQARTQELAEAGVVAKKDLEQAQTDLVRARAEASRTRLHLKSLGAASTVDQHFALRSPIAGVVVERNTNPGMEWRPDQPGAPLFVVSDPTYLWAWIDAPEQAIGLLHPNAKVVLRSSAWPQETFEAQIDFVGDALDPVSRTMKVRARLRNTKRLLKGEMYVTAELTSQTHGTLNVPASAVFLQDAAQQVFVRLAEGRYERKTITPVERNDQWVSIADGLNKGDEVVVDGALYLQKMLNDSVK
jgi:cobalt-zinc-cadmium efflux system membrane fusion protein